MKVNMPRHPFMPMLIITLVMIASPHVQALERTEHFDSDPDWEGINNLPLDRQPVIVHQDFGYNTDSHYFDGAGEIGGRIMPAGEAAWYAKPLSLLSLNDPLTASGKMVVPKGRGNTLIGFFHSGSTNEWRTPNSIVIRINGRGDVFHTHVEYATTRWRAGASFFGTFNEKTNRMNQMELPSGDHIYEWTLDYDPGGNEGKGTITLAMDGKKAICNLDDSHKLDGATFEHFGILNVIKSYDDVGEIHLSDLVINGQHQDLSSDPGWDGHNNRNSYPSLKVRPWFEFGYSPSQFAEGLKAGEMGGQIYRGDCREVDRLASYADRLSTLTLDAPLKASGKVKMLNGVSDSTTLLGFFNSGVSMRVNPSQKFGIPPDFLGVAIEGPSSDGFLFYPIFHGAKEVERAGQRRLPGHSICPDGAAHTWELEYMPGDEGGQIKVTFDGDQEIMEMKIRPEDGAEMMATKFNRFGLISTHIDGNGQIVYFDDLTYTMSQDQTQK